MEGKDFPIGTQYISAGKHKRLCTYVATHELLGQTVIDRDVVKVTIQRGLIK